MSKTCVEPLFNRGDKVYPNDYDVINKAPGKIIKTHRFEVGCCRVRYDYTVLFEDKKKMNYTEESLILAETLAKPTFNLGDRVKILDFNGPNIGTIKKYSHITDNTTYYVGLDCNISSAPDCQLGNQYYSEKQIQLLESYDELFPTKEPKFNAYRKFKDGFLSGVAYNTNGEVYYRYDNYMHFYYSVWISEKQVEEKIKMEKEDEQKKEMALKEYAKFSKLYPNIAKQLGIFPQEENKC